jgi:hypothetical protein
MLDQEQLPQARDLARVRAAYDKRQIAAPFADSVLKRVGAVEMAERLAPLVQKAHDAAALAGLSIAEGVAILDDVLSQMAPAEGEKVTSAKNDAMEKAVLDKVLQARVEASGPDQYTPGSSNSVGNSFDGGAGFRAKMVAGLGAKLDPAGASPKGRDAAQMTLADIAMATCRLVGLRPHDAAEAVRMAAHSTSDFPLILENALTNQVARKIEQRMPDLMRASHEIAREDYRPGKSLSLSASGVPQEVSEGGEINFVTADEKGEALPKVRDFASGFNITNQAMANDATATRLLGDIGNRMTQGAIERLRMILLEPIEANAGAGQTMADNVNMFHALHGNLASTGAVLSVSSLTEARVALRKMRGLKGELLAIEPWALVVPAELETSAQQLVALINAAKTSDANPFSGKLEIVVEPGLSAPAAWYLIGDPERHEGLAHAFLDGQRNPLVESRAGWNTLGMEFRLTWALDAKFIETATWFKNPGPSE